MRYSAVLLAGGKSSRMGQNKAFLEIGGRPLWRRQLETLREMAPDRMLISGPARDEWNEYEIVPDDRADAGPLAGIAAALGHCTTPRLLVLAVDLPRMTSAFLRSLLPLGDARQGVVPSKSGRFEPLAAIYPRAVRSLAQAALATGDFSLQSFVRKAQEQGLICERPIEDDETVLFTNLNTPADL